MGPRQPLADHDLSDVLASANTHHRKSELAFLDKWVRDHTTVGSGPVHEVKKSRVPEVEFDAAQYLPRRKSGAALRFPRIARLRRDKPAAEADRLETLEAMIKR